MIIVLEFHVILLIIYDYRASTIELRNTKNRAQGRPMREPIKTGRRYPEETPNPVKRRISQIYPHPYYNKELQPQSIN